LEMVVNLVEMLAAQGLNNLQMGCLGSPLCVTT